MKLTTLFISIIWTLTSAGQSLTEIKQLLADRDFVAFKRYIDTASSKYTKATSGSNVRAIWDLKRDITPIFQEAIVDIDESFPDKDKPGISTVYRYRINLIATDKEIVYYDFGNKASKSASWDDFELDVLDSLRNKRLMDSLQSSFSNNYATQLNWKELFIDTNVYGYACSIAGEMPDMRQELQIIISKKNYQILNDWLKSANTEKQVYAVDGLYQLKRKGYKLTGEQQKLISILKSKKGQLNVCRGCIYSSDSIGEIVNGIIAGRKI
jgi:hypothetical protein